MSILLSTPWLVGLGIFILAAILAALVTLASVWGDRKVSEERANDPERLRQPRRRVRR
jgi:hypothetical protein